MTNGREMCKRSIRVKCFLTEFGRGRDRDRGQRIRRRQRAASGDEISRQQEFEYLAPPVRKRARATGPAAQEEERCRAFGVFFNELSSCCKALNVCGLIDQECVFVV